MVADLAQQLITKILIHPVRVSIALQMWLQLLSYTKVNKSREIPLYVLENS